MKSLKDQGFYVEWTGGNCSAWVKKLPTGQYIVITCGGGCDHKFDVDMLVGIYDGSEEEGMWGNCIDSFEIDLTDDITKQFEATWGDGYAIKETRTITLDDVTEANGYFEENILIVQSLLIGDTADLSDIGGVHTIKRIK